MFDKAYVLENGEDEASTDRQKGNKSWSVIIKVHP